MKTPTNIQHQQQQTVALYARVSSDRQREEGTIESQVEALLAEAKQRHWLIPEEWIFRDEGYSGANLERPGLEVLRDLACEGDVATVLVYAPDRLARKYALQVLLLEEFSGESMAEIVRKLNANEVPTRSGNARWSGMEPPHRVAPYAETGRRRNRKAQTSVS